MQTDFGTSALYDCATLEPAILRQSTEALAKPLSWPRARIVAHQETSLRQTLRHAANKSPYFRDVIGRLVETDAPLGAYPTMGKSILMAEFDRIVTDPRLTRAMVEDHAGSRNCGQLLLNEYRVLATGGSSGQRGVFVYDRKSWETVSGTIGRWNRLSGALPTARVVGIGAPSPVHLSNRFYAEIRVTNPEAPRLSVVTPIEEIVDSLNRYQPDIISTYPSLIRRLAEEQVAGRLRISPATMRSVAEALSPDVRELARVAWNIQLINGYSSTEVPGIASECLAHEGLHLSEDTLILEIVDDDLQPVLPGRPGSKALITSFLKNTIPIIRYEFSDILTAIEGPCACGCQFRRIKDVEGRREEMLYTLTSDGKRIEVHAPRFWFHLVRVPGIRHYQFAQLPKGIAIRVVPEPSHDADSAKAAVERIAQVALADLGADSGQFEVHIVDEIRRTGNAAKQKLVTT